MVVSVGAGFPSQPVFTSDPPLISNLVVSCCLSLIPLSASFYLSVLFPFLFPWASFCLSLPFPLCVSLELPPLVWSVRLKVSVLRILFMTLVKTSLLLVPGNPLELRCRSLCLLCGCQEKTALVRDMLLFLVTVTLP